MSVVYVPRRAGGAAAVEAEAAQAADDAHAWVAWEEDATPAGAVWRPAACNAYVRVDLAGRFW